MRDLSVRPLDPPARQELTQTLLGTESASDPDLVRRIAEESEGHPLLIEELVRHAVSPHQRVPAAEPGAPGPLLNNVINRRWRIRFVFGNACRGHAVADAAEVHPEYAETV